MMMLYEIIAVRTQFPEHAILYILGAVVCLMGVVSFAYCRKHFGVIGCGFLICTTCFTDIGAYLFGKTLGGPKLCPKISPNKTWAGFAGGIFGSLLGISLVAALGKRLFHYTPDYAMLLLMAALCNLLGQLGDLSMSMVKREAGVKDFSQILLAHGGILDRFDSMLFIAPVVCASVQYGII